MDKVLRELIDLKRIKQLENSECQNPEEILGAHPEKVGMMYSAYLPDAKQVSVRVDGQVHAMERVDSEGFFAMVLMDQKRILSYQFLVEYVNGDTEEIEDPYSRRFGSIFSEEDLRKFEAGTFYKSYEKMGAHPMTIDGVAGVHFAVWAPNAMRVSVVGDFNFWNGKRHQMKKLTRSGIYELFIPGLKTEAKYKFEVKTSKAELLLKSDPYAFCTELRPATASVVWDGSRYQWHDQEWMTKRKDVCKKEMPMSIYEVHLGSWMQRISENGSGNFDSYEELAELLSSYVKEMGFTHVELMPVMEHPLDASWGYQITGYYAPTSRYGTPDGLKMFVDRMHQEGIGVILDWNPSHFPKDVHGLASFDGTCVYEHLDPRQGENPEMGTLVYNYGRPQVSNFLISNALYWANEYHVDGIRAASVDSMLYLDYGRASGGWIANMYGGHENLDAVEFIKHLNSIFHRETQGAIMIAEESTAWPRITGDLKEEGLGFDYKWNSGWQNDFLRYMKCASQDRYLYYGDLALGMLYAYSEDYIQGFSHAEVVHGNGSMYAKMPGNSQKEKFAQLRAVYGYLFGHPGKKHLFMGQEFGQTTEWSEAVELDWDLAKQEDHTGLQTFVKALNHLYTSHPALYERDYEPEGFEWINCTSDRDNIVVFSRSAEKKEDTLVFVCNFGINCYEAFGLGVPFAGEYKEILNSDAEEFGGTAQINAKPIKSCLIEKDNRENSISIRLAPMSVCVFAGTPEMQEMSPETNTNVELKDEEIGIPGIVLGKLSEKVGKLIKKNK
ncbi:MAG: 1,4-alpha-glucan branching protein GlgB [Lachnospiraceae bacterium]|nr:1,4-alpha-glucan branching protein GlgB [Lachnospiraceae bacterium]